MGSQVPTKKAVESYAKEEIMGLSKEELVVKLFDIGIESCIAKDKVKVINVLAELIDSLNFDYGEIPARLFRLYEYAMRETRKGNFREPLNILQELRNTWVKAFKLENKYEMINVTEV